MSWFEISMKGAQFWFFRILRLVAAQKSDHFTYAFTSHGKCMWSDVTCNFDDARHRHRVTDAVLAERLAE